MQKHFDVIIIGAGLSGIGAARHLQKECPKKTYAILEARESIGGTWDLFHYPGIRSDSPMLTMGYAFRPWLDPKNIVDGHLILEYIIEAAREAGIEKKIYLCHKAVRASWSSKEACWTIEVTHPGGADRNEETLFFTCNFLFVCGGYYKYNEGYTPAFQGIDRFKGTLIHPQKWPQDFSYADKRIIVIGSGATAVTLVPTLAKKAAHVTLLQRSPSYILSVPSQDIVMGLLRHIMPVRFASGIARWFNILLITSIYTLSRRYPNQTKKMLISGIQKELGKDYDVDKHFTPFYNPWQQRLCIAPEGDLFAAIRNGQVDMVTDHIETFTEKGLKLKSGKELESDIIVTATGLAAQFLGGIKVCVDGNAVDFSKALSYKGVLLNDVPNLAYAFGYINNSWTLKLDLVCTYVCRLLNYMDKKGVRQVTPRIREESMLPAPLLDYFTPGYVQRVAAEWPKQGTTVPWRVFQNYFRDLRILKYGSLNDDALEYSNHV